MATMAIAFHTVHVLHEYAVKDFLIFVDVVPLSPRSYIQKFVILKVLQSHRRVHNYKNHFDPDLFLTI